MRGDRATFRPLMGAIGLAVVEFNIMAFDSRLPDHLANMTAHWELRTLQAALNGILGVSRNC